MDGLHYYTTYIKFGLGRASYDAAQEIRNRHLTREEGVALVRRFDGEFPRKWFQENLDYMGHRPRRVLGRSSIGSAPPTSGSAKATRGSCVTGLLILVPARAGSKGLPGKNVKLLGGAPLLGWTARAIAELGCRGARGTVHRRSGDRRGRPSPRPGGAVPAPGPARHRSRRHAQVVEHAVAGSSPKNAGDRPR